jgi:hypothetical protein
MVYSAQFTFSSSVSAFFFKFYEERRKCCSLLNDDEPFPYFLILPLSRARRIGLGFARPELTFQWQSASNFLYSKITPLFLL